jgi:hypothetical protein
LDHLDALRGGDECGAASGLGAANIAAMHDEFSEYLVSAYIFQKIENIDFLE